MQSSIKIRLLSFGNLFIPEAIPDHNKKFGQCMPDEEMEFAIKQKESIVIISTIINKTMGGRPIGQVTSRSKPQPIKTYVYPSSRLAALSYRRCEFFYLLCSSV